MWFERMKKEIILIGRSNVGKSSIFRHLTGKKKGVAIGKHPGTTLEFFRHEMKKYILVDFPGIRYKQAKNMQRKIISYVERNANPNFRVIQTALLIIDVKLFPELVARWKEKQTPLDIELFKFLQDHELNPIIACNKIDKVPPVERNQILDSVTRELEIGERWQDVPEIIVPCSAKTGEGIETLKRVLDQRFVN